MSDTQPLTTGQAAEYCHVSQATIINWIRRGKLRAYTTPGGHYRIPLDDFLSFLEAYDMPIDPALRALSPLRVLLVSDSPRTASLAQTLKANADLDVALANTDYEACAQVASLEPDAVVLDVPHASQDCLALCRWMHASQEREDVFVIAVGDLESEEEIRAAGADAYVHIDAATEDLKKALEAIVESK